MDTTTPLLWLALCCEEWGVPRALAEQSWQALMRSRWSVPTTLRQWVQVQPYVNPPHFRQHYSPQALATILHNLEKENILTHQCANQLLEYVLTATSKDGHWQQRTTSNGAVNDRRRV